MKQASKQDLAKISLDLGGKVAKMAGRQITKRREEGMAKMAGK